MALNIVARPAMDTATSLPQELRDYFDACGVRPSWQPGNAQQISRIHGRGMVPLTVKMLEEDDEEIAKTASRYLYVNPEGYFQAEDCVLCLMANETFENEMEKQERVRRIKESAENHIESVEAELHPMLMRTGKWKKDRPALATAQVADARDHFVGADG